MTPHQMLADTRHMLSLAEKALIATGRPDRGGKVSIRGAVRAAEIGTMVAGALAGEPGDYRQLKKAREHADALSRCAGSYAKGEHDGSWNVRREADELVRQLSDAVDAFTPGTERCAYFADMVAIEAMSDEDLRAELTCRVNASGGNYSPSRTPDEQSAARAADRCRTIMGERARLVSERAATRHKLEAPIIERIVMASRTGDDLALLEAASDLRALPAAALGPQTEGA